MHSTAQASGSASCSLPPQASAAARQTAGRIRLPPAKSEYRIALWMVAGRVFSLGKYESSARLTASVRLSRYDFRSNAIGFRAPARVAVRDMRGVLGELWRLCKAPESASKRLERVGGKALKRPWASEASSSRGILAA